MPFFPDAFWKDAVAGIALVVLLVGLAIWLGPPELENIADPTFIVTYPRPDWYFLWFFALLSLTPHQLETIVILGVPAVVGVILIGLPFLASRGERSPRRRPWAVGAVILMFVGFIALSVQGHRAPWSPILEGYAEVPFPEEVLAGLNEDELEGSEIFREQGCHACHAIGNAGGATGPELTNVADRMDREIITITILRGRGNMPGYAGAIEPERLEMLVDFLMTLDGEAEPSAGQHPDP